MDESRWYLWIVLAVALVLGGAVGHAPAQQPKDPAKKDIVLADLKGEWVDDQQHDGKLVIITIKFDGDGVASYNWVADRGNGKFEVARDWSTKIEKREGMYVIKLLDGTYRCHLSEKGNLELTLLDGKGPKSWSFGRVKK